MCLNFSNCRVLGIESQRLVPVSMPNQSINRISDDGTHVTMERRVFRFGRLLLDRLQAVTFVKTHTWRPLLGLSHVPAIAWSGPHDAMKLCASLIGEGNLELGFCAHSVCPSL